MKRILRIDHHDRSPAGSQYAPDLPYHGDGVRRMVQHAVAVDEVEGLVVERERLRVVVDKAAAQSPQPKIFFRKPQVTGREIDIGHHRPMRRELRQIGTQPTADFEHVLSAVKGELHRRRHPRRIHTVPVPFHFQEPIERVRLRVASVLRPGRVSIPLVLHLIFVDVPRLEAGRSSFPLARRGDECSQPRPDATLAVDDEHPSPVDSPRFQVRLRGRRSDDDDCRLPKRELFRFRIQFRIERRSPVQRFANQRFDPGVLDDVRDTEQLTELGPHRLPCAEPLIQVGWPQRLTGRLDDRPVVRRGENNRVLAESLARRIHDHLLDAGLVEKGVAACRQTHHAVGNRRQFRDHPTRPVVA